MKRSSYVEDTVLHTKISGSEKSLYPGLITMTSNRASNRGPRKSNKAIADDTRRESTVIRELYRVLHLIIPTGI